MRRLVYSPYVEAFVKTQDGVFDLSPYIVSGSINRKVNQVSSAQLTIRNPIQPATGNLLFTEFERHDGVGPLISPMDPITIIMTRLQAHPVQVFTGYVDKAPYLQLYPGVCTIEASCTLKRLLYTQWDAALPFVEYFLQQFGWQLNGNGIANPTADAHSLESTIGKVQGQFNDGSLGSLLYVVLQAIGDWDSSTIYIEKLPQEIKDVVIALYHRIQTDVQAGAQLFNTFIQQVLGTSSHGGGGGGSSGGGGGPGGTYTIPTGKNNPFSLNQLKFAAEFLSVSGLSGPVVMAWMAAEEGAGRTQTAYNNNQDWLNVGGPGARAGAQSGLWTDPVTSADNTWQWIIGKLDVPGFGHAAQSIQTLIPAAVGKSDAAQEQAIDQSQWLPGGYGTLGQLAGLYGKYAPVLSSSTSSSSTSVTPKHAKGASGAKFHTNYVTAAPTATAATASPGPVAQIAGKSPGKKNGFLSGVTNAVVTANTNANGVVNPIPGFVNISLDFGVDADGVTAGQAILAPAACTIAAYLPQFYGGSWGMQPLILYKFDQPIPSAPSQYWYVSEGIAPVSIHVGDHFNQGDTVATWRDGGTGIEIGWGTTDAGSAYRYAQQKLGAATDHLGPAGNSSANIYGTSFQNYFSIGGGSAVQGRVSGGSGGNSGGGGGGNSTGGVPASAFSTMIALPSIFQMGEALAFTGKRSFMADQPLFPFVSQLCQASMRNFMSMPNGNFFAFFPDYFGIFGRKYYWEIHDIEIIDARIDLCDDPLATHVAIAGDTYTYPSGQVTQPDLLLTSGIFDIFDAFVTGYVGNAADPALDIRTLTAGAHPTKPAKSGTNSTATNDALAFLQKFGARPLVEEIPAIRNPFFELFYAFQTFMMLWSKQFETTFELTFMPELFPGGLVGLPEHHLQLYVEEVIHYFDYENGFSTTASVSSPSKFDDATRTNVSEGLSRWGPLEKVLKTGATSAGKGAVQGVRSVVNNKP